MTVANRLLQTELGINTNVVVSDIRHDVVNTRTIVSDVQRTVVKIQEGIEGKNLSVSTVCTASIIGSMLIVAQAQARSAIPATNKSSI